MTFDYVEVLTEAHSRLAGEVDSANVLFDQPEAGREFALARTHLEDAIMRINRGFAKREGSFKVGNVQKELGL